MNRQLKQAEKHRRMCSQQSRVQPQWRAEEGRGDSVGPGRKGQYDRQDRPVPDGVQHHGGCSHMRADVERPGPRGQNPRGLTGRAALDQACECEKDGDAGGEHDAVDRSWDLPDSRDSHQCGHIRGRQQTRHGVAE